MSFRFKSTSSFHLIGSLYQWVLLSFLLVSLPLFFAISYALSSMQEYAEQERTTLYQSVLVTENSRLMLERLNSMERSIRQFQVLKEEPFLEAFVQHHDQFRELMAVSEFDSLPPSVFKNMQTVKLKEAALFETINEKVFVLKEKLSAEELKGFEALNLALEGLIQSGVKQQIKDIENLESYEETVIKETFSIALFAGFVAVVLSIFFVSFITLPIKHLAGRIRRLVSEDFQTQIVGAGPKDIRELGNNVENLRLELRYLENEKQHFVRNISHELKTPLATLKEGVDLLADEIVGDLNIKQREVVHLLQLGNFNITNLIENLLEYQKAISIQSKLSVSEFCLLKLATSLEKEYKLLLASKQLRLKIKISEKTVETDREKLKIILSNLLSNAIKFAPQASTISLSAKVESGKLFFSVEDQGDGIDESMREKIFEDFFQENRSEKFTLKGTGLGLTIVRFYVEKLDGSIELLAPSEDYPGARFSLMIPIR